MSMFNDELRERFLELGEEEVSNKIEALLDDGDFINFVLETKSQVSVFIDSNLELNYRAGSVYSSEYPLCKFNGLDDLDYSDNDYIYLLEAIIDDELADSYTTLEYLDLEEDKEEYLEEVEKICSDFRNSSLLYKYATDEDFKNEHYDELEDMLSDEIYRIKLDEYFVLKHDIECDIYKMLYKYEAY